MFPPPTNPSAAGTPPPSTMKKRPLKKILCPYENCVDAHGIPSRFTCEHNKLQHIRSAHTNQRPYQCWLCPEGKGAFARPWSLNRHLWMLHNVKVTPDKRRTKPAAKKDLPGVPSDKASGFDGQAQEDRGEFDLDQFADGFADLNTGTKDTSTEDVVFQQIQCHQCKALLDSQEAALVHLHQLHDGRAFMSSPFCACPSCNILHQSTLSSAPESFEDGGFRVCAQAAERSLSPMVEINDPFHDLQDVTFPPQFKPDFDSNNVFAKQVFDSRAPQFFADGAELGSFAPENFRNPAEYDSLMRDLDAMVQWDGVQ